MNKIRIAVLGPGTISHRFVKGAKMCDRCEVYGVGSRSLERAKAFAELYDIPVYGTYDDILKDPDVDAIYLATINITHYDLITRCLKAKKHVLSEKPMVFTTEEAKTLFALARENNVILMEAMKALFLPLSVRIKQMIHQGVIGDLIYMDGQYSYQMPKEYGQHKTDASNGGGQEDVGVYPIGYFNFMADSPIAETTTFARYNEYGKNMTSNTLIKYENGILASAVGGLEVWTENKMRIYGTEGYIEVYNFWKAAKGKLVKGDTVMDLEEEMESDFLYETNHFAECIQKGLAESPVMGEFASLEVIRTFENRK
ncbi:MAG: Gfo/Idh/MocA family oxidoreductase [Erysipelotrichaceae bacterium]|nr:Gfo/Idh/MocA family oxidoreductase [Erysipelotrichaceae bacterium]